MSHECEILWDGRTVWVNLRGASVGRFSRMGIDVHSSPEKQLEGGSPCLDCRRDASLDGWAAFVAGMHRYHGVEIPTEAMPEFLAK